ncbi:unnamed protein product, partial [Mesorhabditis belari]|uniref:Uncharacterized protein n=1 Tax=Mesorhabditis belari TaxID=2138241 RepID=A0AAF3EX27_9BILA
MMQMEDDLKKTDYFRIGLWILAGLQFLTYSILVYHISIVYAYKIQSPSVEIDIIVGLFMIWVMLLVGCLVSFLLLLGILFNRKPPLIVSIVHKCLFLPILFFGIFAQLLGHLGFTKLDQPLMVTIYLSSFILLCIISLIYELKNYQNLLFTEKNLKNYRFTHKFVVNV